MTAPIAEFTDYDGLRRALVLARERRDISFERLDAIAGAPAGYFAKLLGPRANKRVGMQSLGWAFGALGIKCQIVEDIAAFEMVEGRFVVRDAAHLTSATKMHAPAVQITISRKKLAIISRKGGIASWAKLTPKQRSKRAKKMAKERWRKVKARRAKGKRRTRCTSGLRPLA
jgi:hypothetical protein